MFVTFPDKTFNEISYFVKESGGSRIFKTYYKIGSKNVLQIFAREKISRRSTLILILISLKDFENLSP